MSEQVNITFPDRSVYIGEYRDGKAHGHGTWIFPDGSGYSG